MLTLFCHLLPAMKKEYDFNNAKKGVVVPQKGKTRIRVGALIFAMPIFHEDRFKMCLDILMLH